MWFWLQQNAPAMQAFGGLLSFLVALITVPLLFATMRVAAKAANAAVEQANAAKAQVEAAEAATRLSELQLEAARSSAAAEREHSDIIRQQSRDALLPVLAMTRRVSQVNRSEFEFAVRNQGPGIAFNVRGFYGNTTDRRGLIGTRENIIGPSSFSVVPTLQFDELRRIGGHLIFTSADGRSFVTEVRVDEQSGFRNDFREVTVQASDD